MTLKFRGFKLKHRVIKLFRFVSRENRNSSGYHRLDRQKSKCKSVSRIFSSLKTTVKAICRSIPGRVWDPSYGTLNKPGAVPKGKLAVYVGQKHGGIHRVLVPVIYFNHPLFEDLLRETEKEYGFNHQGGIIIPCPISEFESIKTRIAAAGRSRRMLTWKNGS